MTDRGDINALDALYASRFSENSPGHLVWRRQVWAVLVRDFFSRWISRNSTVLDFGCGLGEFINSVEAARRIGVDLRHSVTEHLESGVEFVSADDSWPSRVGRQKVDVVFCSNFLEHLPDKAAVVSLLKDFRQVLRPGGRLLVLGPNLRYSGHKYWDFFDHILPLTHLSLAEALAASGFETETLIPRFLPFTTVGVRRWPLFLVRGYLRLPLAWKILGAQFFAVARPR